MINSLQLQIHMTLINIRMPNNAQMCFDLLSALTQKDIYPTDDIYEYVFDFTETESPIKRFEVLGFEGANFVCVSGSVLINAVLSVFSALLINFLQYFTKKYYKVAAVRKLGMMLP